MSECCRIQRPLLPISNAISSCCATTSPSSWTKKVSVICRIFLCVIGIAIAPVSFLTSLTLGMIIGTCYLLTKKDFRDSGDSKPVCAQGYMDFLADMRFPTTAGTIATAVFIAEHLHHNPKFYVPFCGFFLGFWFSRSMQRIMQSE